VNTTYDVVFTPTAVSDLQVAYAWAAKNAPTTASAWVQRLKIAIASLSNHPKRCPLASENHKVTLEIRQLTFGRRKGAFRIVFAIHEQEVRILRILRAQRRSLSRRELEQADDMDD
jgi:plasmid stabilization system protein ParE